jgi:Uma2 family endonuclease
MRASELFALYPEKVGIDRWLFDGEPIERRDGAGPHTPAHAAAVANLSLVLHNWCCGSDENLVFGYGCPFLLACDPDTLLTFDASVVPRDLCDAFFWGDMFIEGPPLLAVEVIEPGEDAQLLTRLVETSLGKGVSVVWIVDPHEETVTVHRRDGRATYRDGLIVLDDLPGFRCPVAEIFE